MTITVAAGGPDLQAGLLQSLTYRSDHGRAVVRRREHGAAVDVAPWVLEVELEGHQRFGFWPDEPTASAAALEVLGLLAEAAHAEERARAAIGAAAAVVEADVFAGEPTGAV